MSRRTALTFITYLDCNIKKFLKYNKCWFVYTFEYVYKRKVKRRDLFKFNWYIYLFLLCNKVALMIFQSFWSCPKKSDQTETRIICQYLHNINKTFFGDKKVRNNNNMYLLVQLESQYIIDGNSEFKHLF
jgi:hypothetical protein